MYAAAQTTAKEWYDKGVNLKVEKKYEDAIVALKKAANLNSSYDQAWYMLGWCYNELEKYEDALNALQKVKTYNEVNKANQNFEMGFAYYMLLKYDEALEKFNATIDFNPEYMLAYKERGNCYYKMKDYEKALDDFNTYTSKTNEISESGFFHKKGWCENELEKYEDAVVSLKRSIALDNSFPETYNELGYAYYKLNKNDESISQYHNAYKISKETYYTALKGIANVYYDNLKNYDSALVYLEKYAQFQKKDKVVYYKIGWCYNNMDKFEKAISFLEQALALDDEYEYAKTELGYANYKLGYYDKALKIFLAIMQQNPKDILSRYYAGSCYYYKKDQKNLQKMIDELTALNTKDALQFATTLKEYIQKF